MRVRSMVLIAALVLASCGGGDRPQLAAPSTSTPAVTEDPVATATAAAEPSPAPTPTLEPTPTVVPDPTATPEPTPSPTPAPTCTSRLPDRIALAQLLMPLATPGQFAAAVDLVATNEVGWVGLLGAPTTADLALLRGSDDVAGPLPILIASDEEGGTVQRLRSVLGPLPSAAELATEPLEDIEARFLEYGTGMRELGIDVAFAPVVDVGGGPGIGERAFSADPDAVTRNAEAVVIGYWSAGVTPVLKHFPGHGRASNDTHLGFASTPSLDELWAADLLPFEALVADDVMVMVGHLLVPGLTEDRPTSLAPEAIDGLLRDEIGFKGIVITDALGMGAISQRWSNAEAARLAFVAGADVAIIDTPSSVRPVLDALELALADGSLSRDHIDDSLDRVLRRKGLDPCTVLSALEESGDA